MRRIAPLFTVLVLLTSASLAQSSSPAPQIEEKMFSGITDVTGARIENWGTLASPASALSPDACTANTTTLCLNNGRFQVRVIFSAPSLGITNAPAQVVPLTSDTGYFWFFSANNVEIALKVVDGRPFNGFFWVFYGALSDVLYTITVTDMNTGAVKIYSNPQGSLASVADVTAFSGGSTCSYTVSTSSPASFGSAGGTGTFNVATSSGCAWTATSNVSWIAVTSGASGSGNGTVGFSVGPNSSSSIRTGTLNIGGQLAYVEQAGTSSGGGNYNGTWSGTTSQGKPISFVIANSALTTFSVGYSVSGGDCSASGTSTITYNPPRSVGANGFVISIIGFGNPALSYTVTVDFNSTSSASGTASFTLTQSSPLPSCNATGSATFSLSKS